MYRYAIWRQKAKILESMNDVSGASKEYAHVLWINPGDVWSLEHLAQLCISDGRVDEALRLIERLVEQRPDHENAAKLKMQATAAKNT